MKRKYSNKGKMPKNTKRKYNLNTKSIFNRDQFLKKIIDSPKDISSENRSIYITALKNQTSFAKFNFPKEKITPMSLNTLKSRANDTLDIEFIGLNDLRKLAYDKLTKLEIEESRPNRNTRLDILNEKKELKKEIQSYYDQIALMTLKLNECLILGDEFAKMAGKQKLFDRKKMNWLLKFSQSKLKDI